LDLIDSERIEGDACYCNNKKGREDVMKRREEKKLCSRDNERKQKVFVVKNEKF
jgi:hypothetical protein